MPPHSYLKYSNEYGIVHLTDISVTATSPLLTISPLILLINYINNIYIRESLKFNIKFNRVIKY